MEDDRQDQINTNEADVTKLIAKDKTVLGKGGHVLNDGLKKGETSPLHKETSSSGKDVAHSQGLKIIIAASVIFATVITIALILFIYLGKPQVGASGAVASDVSVCSDLGLAVLERGGNAVDAMVTTMLCTGVVNPHQSGIGGGGFMIVYDHKTKKSEVIDFRETAPSSADHFNGDKSLIEKGVSSVGVPGELKGLEAAHKKYGKLTWSSLVDPAISLAREGYKVTKSMDDMFKSGKLRTSDLSPNLQKYFVKDGGFVTLGTEIKRPDLAEILQQVSEKGSSAIYKGKYAEEIVDALTPSSSSKIRKWVTGDDLESYEVKYRDIVQTNYHESSVMTIPAPGAGLSVLSTLNMLEGYSLIQNDPTTVHRMLEALKFASAQQQQLGDPDFNKEKVHNITLTMLDKVVASKHRNMTTNITHADPVFYGGSVVTLPVSTDGGASHVSVVDAQELMVSATSSVNSWFGSGITTKSGIVLNNQMANFEVPGSSISQLNDIAGGKRPQSNMAPTIVVKSKVSCARRLNLGATDGDSTPSAVVQTVVNVLSYNMNLTASIQAPRIYSILSPEKVVYEKKFRKDIVSNLTTRGHNLEQTTGTLNCVQGVKKVKDEVEAYSDARDGGRAAQF